MPLPGRAGDPEFAGGLDLLRLDTLLAGCRVRKEGARLFSEAA